MGLLQVANRLCACGYVNSRRGFSSAYKVGTTSADGTASAIGLLTREAYNLSTRELSAAITTVSTGIALGREFWPAAEKRLLQNNDLHTLPSSSLARLAQCFARHQQGSHDLFDQIQKEACNRWNKLSGSNITVLAQSFAKLRYNAADFFQAIVNLERARLQR